MNISASCTGNSSAIFSCTILSTSNISIVLGSSLSGNSNIKITVNDVKNGPEAKQSSNFKIYTFYVNNQVDTLVDQLVGNLTITLEANPLQGVNISATNATTFAITSYVFNIILTD